MNKKYRLLFLSNNMTLPSDIYFDTKSQCHDFAFGIAKCYAEIYLKMMVSNYDSPPETESRGTLTIYNGYVINTDIFPSFVKASYTIHTDLTYSITYTKY